MPKPLKIIVKDLNNVVLTDEEFDRVPVAKKFELDVICGSCGSHDCFFFKKDIPFNTYSFSIGCHNCGESEDY